MEFKVTVFILLIFVEVHIRIIRIDRFLVVYELGVNMIIASGCVDLKEVAWLLLLRVIGGDSFHHEGINPQGWTIGEIPGKVKGYKVDDPLDGRNPAPFG